MKKLKIISAILGMLVMAMLYGSVFANSTDAGVSALVCSAVILGVMLLPIALTPVFKRLGFSLLLTGSVLSMGYSATVLQTAIYKAGKKDPFQANEMRKSTYGAFDVAMTGTPELLPATTLKNLKMAANQAEKINVFQKEALGTGTTRVCAGTGDGTTAQVTLTWSSYVEQFGMSIDNIEENQYEYAEIFEKRWENKHRSFYKRFENAAIAYLETKANKGDGKQYKHFGNAKQVPLSDWDISTNRSAQFMNKIKAEMLDNDYAGQYVVIGNTAFAAVWAAMTSQGGNTATKLDDQFLDFEFHCSNSLLNDTGVSATAYIFQKGMFGVIPWTKPKNRRGYSIGTDTWSLYNEPRYSMEIEQKYSAACYDNSGSLAKSQDDLIEGFGLAVDLAFITAYSSDSNTGIYKYELLPGNTISSGS